jgi:RNA polymerase sigma-70 factor (ECF subfamily)
MLNNEADAVDAMQDTFVRVLRNQERLDDAAPSSLLYRIATNVCLNKIRTQKRHPENPDDALMRSIASLSDLESTTAQRGLIGRIFGGQQESTAAIAFMHYVDRMTLQEVADEVGMSVSGVRKRLRTLRGQLEGLQEVAS